MTSESKNNTYEQVVQQLQVGSSIPDELSEIFALEAEDHLETIYDGLQRLQTNRSDAEALADVRRASHTFKGAAGAVNMQAASQLAHRMEDLLDCLAATLATVSEDQLQLLLATADQLQGLAAADFEPDSTADQIVQLYQAFEEEMQDSANASPPSARSARSAEAPATLASFVEQADENLHPASVAGSESTGQATQYLRVPLDRLDQLVSLLGEMMVNRSEYQHCLDDFSSRIEDMQSAMQRLGNAIHRTNAHQRFKHARQTTDRDSAVRSSFEFHGCHNGFDSLEFETATQAGQLDHKLSEAENDAEMLAGEFWKIKSTFGSLVRRQEKLNREAQKNLMRIRMVPLSGIVSRLERTVRTVAGKLGRAVELEIVGDRIELDKSVLDGIVDPMLHLIRNAIDHGIEDPAVRAAAGKPETSRLRIVAVNQGTQIEIRICDDGAGINVEKIRAKALQQELIAEGHQATDDELRSLIFRPGFSTAQSLTDVSGRGVGMDVVSDAIRRLKGTIGVESQPGIGTTFIIRLPTNLGVMRAVFVESGGSTFAIPMQTIRQIQLLDPLTVTKSESACFTKVDHRKLRLLDLGSQLGRDSKIEGRFDQRVPLLLVDNGIEEIAMTVDAVFGSQDIVVKTLGDHLKQIPGVIGAMINGDGSVVPILDMAELAGNHRTEFLLKFNRNKNVVRTSHRKLAMVIDDSISVRRVTENLLTSVGWEVVTAHDGVDALEKLAELENAPDVFLSDLEMPRMDGLELIRQIREQPEFERTPIVMVTSRASEKHRHKAYEAGATDYMVKPFNDVKLIKIINSMIQQSETAAVV